MPSFINKVTSRALISHAWSATAVVRLREEEEYIDLPLLEKDQVWQRSFFHYEVAPQAIRVVAVLPGAEAGGLAGALAPPKNSTSLVNFRL